MTMGPICVGHGQSSSECESGLRMFQHTAISMPYVAAAVLEVRVAR